MNDNEFLLDIPEKVENDAIGYKVYVDIIVKAIKSDAKMIGLLSNYGSGKSTIINMVKDEILRQNENKRKKVKLIPINVWKIKNKKDIDSEDKTIDIHKFILRSLIQYLPKRANKEYYRRKIDNKYSLFNFITKNKLNRYALYLLFALFLFNVIMKLDIVGFTIPRVCNFILDLIFCIGLVDIIGKNELYLSFNKDSSNREINESDTIDCFNEIIDEIISAEHCDKIVICIEDLDRYNDSQTVMNVVEQIYKFYIENDVENEEYSKVKFIISLKPPYILVRDSDLLKSEKSDEDGMADTNRKSSEKEIIKKYKELYEKLFDVIIDLQTISYQNYGSVLLNMLNQKSEMLKSVDLELPDNEENIGIWSYLYKGKNVSVRDIKHRYNYFLTVYENLYNHKKFLENENLIHINVESCLFVAYLEDEFTDDFYRLLDDSQEFNNVVTRYIFNNEMMQSKEYSEEFIEEVNQALEKGIIAVDYSMYFYKYPKGLPILNIYDFTVQNAIFANNSKSISNFDMYCSKASKNIIVKSIKQKYNESGIPTIVFKNNILFHEAYNLYHEALLSFLSENYVFSSDGGVGNVRKMLGQINYLNKFERGNLLESYIHFISNDLEINFAPDKIIEYRREIIKTVGLRFELKPLYRDEMPLITSDEITSEMSPSVIFELINPVLIKDDSVLEMIQKIKDKDIDFKDLISFLDKISTIDKELFKKMFYTFDYTKYNKKNKYELYKRNYSGLELDKIEELKRMSEKTEILPYKNEKHIIYELNKMTGEDKEKYEQLYIDIINAVKNISSLFKNYISTNSILYIYNEAVEDKLYEKSLYKEYVYSKFNRCKHLIYEQSKFDNLKESILNYFENSSRLNDEYIIDKEISIYIKQKLRYENLSFSKIKFLLKVPQTYEDFLCVFNKNYKDPDSEYNNVTFYLNNIDCFDEISEDKFTAYFCDIIKNTNLSLTKGTYNYVRKYVLKSVSNKQKFQNLRKLCK